MNTALLFLLLCISTINYNVLGEYVIKDPTFCGRMTCTVPAGQKFKYAEGVVYRYQHSINVSTNLGQQDETSKNRNESTLYIDSIVSLHFTTPCEGYLRINNASVSHNRSSYNPEFPDRAGANSKSSLEQYILRFAFHDGHIHEVCPHPKEAPWVLNLKRGVLSMFQNTMKRFDVDHKLDEMDVNGICETNYKLHEAKKTSLIIKRIKNISSCTHRYKHLSIIQSTSYRNLLSPSQPVYQPLLKSWSECEITIDHNVYEQVTCTDSHMLQPLSNGDKAGAQTDMFASLHLIEESTDPFDVDDESKQKMILGKRTTLLYDHANTPKPTHGELRMSRDLVKNMCKLNAAEELQQHFSEMFTKFIHTARLLNYPSLSQLLSRANGICKNGRKHIINTLPFIGSNAAVNVMKDLIIKKHITKEKTNDWVTMFALIPRPDRDTLWALAPLLDFQQEIPDAQFILSYSAVIHAYCSNGERDCLRLEPVIRFLSHVEIKLEKGCAPRSHSPAEIKQTLEALKAIGNMGIETESLRKRLTECIAGAGEFLPMEVRVAAVDAHRRLPSCEETRDNLFLENYRNFTLHTELRIASYLQVMRCPDYNVIKTIKNTLKVEEVNQVGSFVWSHLTNLLSSSSPTRVEIQSLLTDRDLGTKFNNDMRKFSRNYDNSFFSEEYNFGANYQGNVIFSPQSYIPRIAMLNVTADLFGESVNIFEVGIRMEGLEFYAEKFFGPDGPFSNEKVGNHLKQFLRMFRSAPNEDEEYWKRVKRLPNVIDNNYDHPRISIGYKIFGNELKYILLDGDTEIKSALTSLNPLAKVKQILSGREIHYENTAMFLDSAYVIPTTAGLPIRLGISGSAACNFKMSGSLDSKRLASNAELEILGNIMPSISVDVTGTMKVDAFYKSAGLKLRSNVYSSSAVQGHLNVKGAKLVRLSLGLPNQKMEVFSVLTDILLVRYNGAEVEEKAVGNLVTGQNQKNLRYPLGNTIGNTTCSWPSLDRLAGLKLCVDYQFSNVTKNPNASYFVLNGPTLFKMSLIKADPTAKNYLLEYKWERTLNNSVIKLTFDTPGSQVKRELSATVFLDVNSQNITVLLQSAGNMLIAKGTYKRSDNESLIDIGLDINGTKHLNASMGYVKRKSNYGFNYSPKLYLAINTERIAELSGTVQNAEKNNVSQCDIQLIFQTKRMWSRVMGYVMGRNTSLSGNVQLEYQLDGVSGSKPPKKETIQVEISLMNRSTKTLTHKAANFKLRSSAYPQLNVVIVSWYRQASGHLELYAEVNSSPYLRDDRRKLTAQLVVTYSKAYFQSQGAKISAFVAVTKPIQNLDIKLGINYSSIGPESNTNVLIRYAPGKEIILMINMITPRGTMFIMEGHANLTIPNFNSMLIDARINEKARHEYDLDFAGTWFSGHNMTARGTYSDRSTSVVMNHGLKILLKSPSFVRDLLINCKLYNDANDLRIDLYMEQIDMDKYAFVLKHTTLSLSRLVTYVESRWKNNFYTIMTNIDTERELRIEMHLDKWRDIHLIARGINEVNKKEFGLELKWDANRDPALKFVTVVHLYKFTAPATGIDQSHSKNVSATVTVTYPGRLITGSCLLALRGLNNYILDIRLDWSPDKTIQLAIDTDYSMQSSEKSLKLESQLLTPFEYWKRTALNARYLQNRQTLIASSSAYWQDSQHILVDFSGSRKENEGVLEWDANCGFINSVHLVKWITANVTHKQIFGKSADTHLLVKYYPDKVIEVKSLWHLDKESDDAFNVTGTLNLVSPLVNYKKAEAKCHLCLMPNWKFYGAASLDMDKRKHTAYLIGDLAQWKESMVQFNLTTPIEKYSFVRGRFGFSEKNKHLVAEVVSPSGPVGLEVLCQLFTGSPDFHVKLLLATPIDLFQRSLLVAKLNKQEADFRIAYNNMTAGFQGVWHYHTITDFHYSYILFTPIQGFQECGVVTKLIVTQMASLSELDVDTEFSIKLANTKIGIKAKGGPKAPPVRIPVKSEVKNNIDEDGEEYSDEQDDEENMLYWRGEFEINAFVIESVVGSLDIDEEDEVYKILGLLKLPQGTIVLDDRLFMEDVFTIRNDLSIDTPFACASEIISVYIFTIDLEKNIYFGGLDLKIKNQMTWIESGLNVNYTYQGEVDDSKTHMLKLNVKTPLEILKFIDSTTVVEIDENLYKVNADIRAEDCFIDLFSSFEMEDRFLDTVVLVKINSPMIIVPRSKITIKKDFTDKEKRIEFGIKVEEPVPKFTNLQVIWHIEDQNFIKASVALETWIESLKSVEANILYANTMTKDDCIKLNAKVNYYPDQEYKFLGNVKNGSIIIDLHSPLELNEHLQFLGTVDKLNDGIYRVGGDIKNERTSMIYKVLGTVTIENDSLSSIETVISPTINDPNSDKVILTLERDKYDLIIGAKSKPINGSVNINYINTFNWDIRAKAEIEKQANKKKGIYQFATFMHIQVDGNATLYIHCETPYKDLESLTFNGNMLLTNETGDVRLDHQLNEGWRRAHVTWKLIYMIDMFGRIIAEYKLEDSAKHIDSKIFFKNPGRAFRNIDTGFDVNVNRERWRFATNATIGFRNQENIDAVLAVKLPPPNNDDHRLLLSYHANKGFNDASYVIGYNAVRGKVNYASDGSIRTATRDIDGHLRLTWGMLPNQTLNNLFNVTFNNKEIGFKYALYTPKYVEEETVVLSFTYDATPDIYSLLDVDVYYPASTRIGFARISYANLANVNGTVNASTPLPNFPYIGCNFEMFTTIKQNRRYIKLFWPNNTAIMNSDYSYHSEKLDSSLDGLLLLEIPLSTRHIGHLTYGYKKRPQITNGYSELIYNGKKVLHGQYNAKSESRAGFEKDRIQITIENIYKPLGIVYVNQYEYSGGNEGTNYPTVELKQVNMYRLDNISAFNIEGESRIKTTHTGQDIQLKAIHSNRTVQLRTDYAILPGEFDHNTWLSLAEDAWAAYHINILNKTTEDIDNQFIVVSFAYPRRNFTFDGSYKIANSELSSDAKLEWDRETEKPRMIGTSFQWKNILSAHAINQQQAILSFKHPSFRKNVTFTGQLIKRNITDLLNVILIVDYSLNRDKLLVLAGSLRDQSALPLDRKYSYEISGKHPTTRLNLGINGSVHKHSSTLVEMNNYATYKRSYLPVENGQLHARIDLYKNEIKFHRENNQLVKYLKIRYDSSSPVYTLNGTLINTPSVNATGAFYLNLQEKLTWLMVNHTPDAMESLRMYGKIPDARNAIFDIWRTYDQDLTISDISFYLRLNHSRLITSMLRWRPELKEDVIQTIKSTVSEVYEEISKDADYWKQYIKSETVNAISDIWDDAQEDLEEFLDDWNNLKELQTDLEDLKKYLNASYNANEFYIKDIVAVGIYVIDELSLRTHIQSLPNILNEIWEVVGESGEAIRNSLLWVIETIKNGYNKLSEIISAIFKGDSMSQITSIVKQFVEKYDMLVKDFHVSFIKYIENLWNKTSLVLSQQWHKFLKLVEPLFIRLIHYLETLIWKASKEVLDFLYDRGNEIITSPYFDRFTNFTHDVDKVYRDIKANDIITNIQKYSALLIHFVKERYFTLVPFGKEIKNVVDEIVTELKDLKKLPSVSYALDKVEQIYDKAKYLYEYFDIKAKVENAIRLVHSKLMDISQTALQAENRYREAKTKFIFAPDQGLMCLEQKLPMSLHAFNQTPEFQEIPEYRAIADVGSYFVTSNTTFWTLYYQYKPYTEPSNWLPPFKAQAMIAGSQHYVTFDGHYFEFAGSCTYLLARDFVRNQFTVLVKYDQDYDNATTTHQIIVLIGEKAIELDVFKDTVKLIGSDTILQLPAEFENGTAFVYQQDSIVTVERKNKQFKLECNLKFNLCTLELSGYYYGKTAGLFGTMDNEQMNDNLASNNKIAKDIGSFAQSWSLDRDKCLSNVNHAITKQDETAQFCQELFTNKSSEFSSCFNVVSPNDYASMCFMSKTETEACTVVMAYMQICMFYNNYLRIPDKCTKCTMMDGSEVPEGEFKKLEGDLVPKSTDIVFIVEAKECNRAIKENRSIDQLVTQLNKELNDQHLKDNRWSLVAFGGDGVYDQPRSLILDSQIFTDNAMHFPAYFENIPIGDGSQDIFAAIRFATQLVFRAGVSKTFILMPCSHCEPQNQSLDYSVLHQVLLEHDITLHILMDGDFQFEKERLNKIFYGLDATKSYTKKDARALTGDADLRRQVKLSKSALGYCTPLSLETNGTIFSANKLRFDKLASIKKFASVFSKRIALTAIPSSCQHCECTADNNGITQMECMPCVYPTPVTVDYEAFNEEESLSLLQPLDDDYGQLDIDDETLNKNTSFPMSR